METQRNPNEPIKPTATGQEGGQQGGIPKSAIAIKSVVVTNKAVAAESTINRAVEGNRGDAVKSAANKAADDKLRRGAAKALCDCALD